LSGSTNTVVSARRRLRPRFTLRLLLVAITAVCIGLAIWTHRAREQRRVVELIEQDSGMVCYERDGPTAPEPRGLVVEWLASVLSRDYLERVVSATVHNRKVLRDLGNLRGLESLQICDHRLNDDDLAALLVCRDLRVIQIGDTYFFGDDVPKSQISDKSLHIIARLPKLETARLHGGGFTRKGIETLASSPTLRDLEIGLCNESVVARDFDKLKHLGRIQTLQAWRPTEAGLGVEEIVKW